ncbi:hypothetical protein PLESTB_001526600 [Pleodorina starrii]|uniref:Heterogeneous nuclear ribonucleoprotein Q acidic domain-containing protein n=1 Tax=Pleodorina starrii TaxID=330485 RepID=A0A9W6BXM6_9CHLO|nr:hypothetical protein PLESTM_001167200 [Pleodorina starrii]GLC59722.1 hypothetical protein PLESTB_001526600 [Pleodorina starrii]GLC75356.1 hypothetical protein PLESTF_001627300 [Pleodorina starrii]
MDSLKRSADVAGILNGGGGPDYKSARADRFESCDHRLRDRIQRMVAGGLVRADDVDDKALDLLKDLKVDDAINVIDQFERAVQGGNVKNKSAYLAGVATRHKHFGHGPKLSKDVQQRLEQLYRTGKMRDSQVFDAKVLEAINDLEPGLAIRVIENFESKDLEDARNINALFMATIKITKEQIARERSYGMPPPPHGYRDSMPPPHHGMPPPPHGMPPPPYGMPPPPYSAPPPYGAPAPYPPPMMHAPPPMAAASPSATRRHYGSEQQAVGVRVDELHNLSPHAPYVPASVALALQRAWDSGNRLVSLLDEGSWKALTEMEAQHGQQVVNEVVEAMNNQQIRNCNAFLISVAKKFLTGTGGSPGAGSYGASGGFGGGGGGYGGGGGGGYGGGGYGGGGPGGPGGQKGVPALNKLHGVLAQRAQDLLVQHSHVLRDSHFDEVVVSQLQKLPEHEALEVLAEVGRHELVGVKNIPAYIMGIINRYKRGGTRPGY